MPLKLDCKRIVNGWEWRVGVAVTCNPLILSPRSKTRTRNLGPKRRAEDRERKLKQAVEDEREQNKEVVRALENLQAKFENMQRQR